MALKSLLYGLKEKDMEAVIHTYDLKDFYYPTLFPIGNDNKTLTWKMLEALAGLRIAGDIVSRGATIPKKTREAISRLQGDIPKIAIAREMNEDELYQYNTFAELAKGKEDLVALVDFWAKDTEYCWKGIAARAEWMALQSISLGKIRLSNTNNSAVISEFDVDYKIPSDQKIGVSVAYDNTTEAHPLTKDFPNAIKLGKKLYGATYKFAFMNVDTFEKFAAQEEVWKLCASYFQNATGTQDAPDLASVNSYLTKKKELYRGLQIIVIDQNITIEDAKGSRVTGNPFEDDVIMFSESKTLGKTFWKTPIDAQTESPAMKVMYGHTLVKKFATDEPVVETTEGIANLFPAWQLAGRSVLMQTSSTSWKKN